MANWNSNYIYGVPLSQDYQEYGVYGESIDTSNVPIDYIGPTYSILYTGVTSYELNGTTYYNYNLYAIPVFRSSDYDSISSDLRSNYVLSDTSYSHSSSSSISYNSSNHGLFTETFNSSYNSFPSLDENNSTTNENISFPSTQVENHTDINDKDSNSEILIESHINTSAFTTQAVVNNSIEYNVLEQDNTVSETDIDEEYEEYLLIHEDSEILNWGAEIEDDDMEESDKVIYEESGISDWSVEIEDDDMKESEKVIYKESKISDYSVETEDGDMKESEKVIYEESKIAEWSVETEDGDMEESDKIIYKESEISDYSVETGDGDMKESEKVIYEESKIAEWSVETEDYDMKESKKVIYEESGISDWSVEIEDDDMKESEKVIYEESKISDYSVETEDDDMEESEKVIYKKSKIAEWSVETEDYDMKESKKAIYEEIKILDWSVETEDDVIESEKDLYEECVHQSLFTEEITVLDWSVEVPDNDVKTDDDDDFNKENSSKDSDIYRNYSTADIKYLKEKLYIEALSGHLYLKESVPVVDILPVIEEEYESVEESDTLELVVDYLKGREKNIPDETEQNIESDVTFDTCEKFIENHATESTIVVEEMKENYLNLIENGLKTVPIFNLSQQNLSNHEGSTIESDESYFNNDNIQMNEIKYLGLKKDSTIESSSKESELFVENVSELVETDHVFNAASHEHQFGKENREPWNCNDESLLKSDEDVLKWNEVISNKTDRNRIMNATGHDSLDTSPHGEYYSKANGVNIMKNGDNASSKRSKKKFNGLRKWFSNLFCCVRKKNSSD